MLVTELHTKAKPALFIDNPVFRKPAWGNNHPLAIPRQTALYDLCKMLGWLNDGNTRQSELADRKTLTRFHDPVYVDVFAGAVEQGKISQENRKKYNLGTMENPLFPGLYERASATVGGSILAARLAMQGRIVFHPAGGTHHGRPNKASGFCYFNDPVFAVLTLLDQGCSRVAYVDVDAHHGDGVQDAFADEPKVRCISIHEENRWPYSGGMDDHGKGYAFNFSLSKGIDDIPYAKLIEKRVIPLVTEFSPDSIVITCGADALQADPLSSMNLSNRALINTTAALCNLAPAAIVLGGGGYNPWTTARLWSALWAVFSHQNIPTQLPPAIEQMLCGLDCDLIDPEDVKPSWTTTLLDLA